MVGAPGAPGYPDFYRDELARTVRSIEPIVGSAAEDIAQEAFIVAMERWPEIAAMDVPGAWVRLVACRMAWRRRRRDLDRIAREASSSVPGTGTPGSGSHLDLGRALGRLSANQRLAVQLHYFADLPVSSIADRLGSHESTVKVWLHRARTQLGATLNAPAGRWISDHVWTADDIVRRLRLTGDGRYVDAVVSEVPVRRARWMVTFDGGAYDIATDEGVSLDRGTFRLHRGVIELRPHDLSGIVTIKPQIDDGRARFRVTADTTAPTRDVPDEVYQRLLLASDGFGQR